MLEDIKFQSYCWSLGTTSFRVKDLNFKIERQLQILKELWNENPEINWNGNDSIQEEYYNKIGARNKSRLFSLAHLYVSISFLVCP